MGRVAGWTAPIAVGLAVLGMVAIVAALGAPTRTGNLGAAPGHGRHSTTSTPSITPEVTKPASRGAERTDVRDRIRGTVLPGSEPLTVSIPTIDVRSRLVDLGLEPDGAMEVPKDPAQAGWFSRGAAPGALGPAVLAGHVTWDGTPAVFYRLGSLRPGDRVTVSRKDRMTAVFVVDRVARYPKTRFPTEAVYGSIDHAGLRLITCGGSYDGANRRYLANVVVFAKLHSVNGPRR